MAKDIRVVTVRQFTVEEVTAEGAVIRLDSGEREALRYGARGVSAAFALRRAQPGQTGLAQYVVSATYAYWNYVLDAAPAPAPAPETPAAGA